MAGVKTAVYDDTKLTDPVRAPFDFYGPVYFMPPLRELPNPDPHKALAPCLPPSE